jgi:magnesium transporter
MTTLGEQSLYDRITEHMRKDITWVFADKTVGQALEWLRQNPPAGRIIYFYVVDRDQRLVGVLPTRRLLLNPPETLLADVMVKHVVALPQTATVLEACEFFIQHRLLAFPVVDDQRRLLGVVDVELYTEEMTHLDEAGKLDDLFQLIGVRIAQAQQANPLLAFRNRFPWLLCNLGAGILAAFLSGVYEEELRRAVALALFIPVVLALAESVSIQSVSLALQSLHGRPPTWRAAAQKVRNELFTGLLLGGASGLIVAGVALVWLGQVRVVLCLLGGIAGGVAGAAVMGLTMPIVLRLMRREPQVAAGPIALACSDMLTLLLYFNLARWLLS